VPNQKKKKKIADTKKFAQTEDILEENFLVIYFSKNIWSLYPEENQLYFRKITDACSKIKHF